MYTPLALDSCVTVTNPFKEESLNFSGPPPEIWQIINSPVTRLVLPEQCLVVVSLSEVQLLIVGVTVYDLGRGVCGTRWARSLPVGLPVGSGLACIYRSPQLHEVVQNKQYHFIKTCTVILEPNCGYQLCSPSGVL